MAFLNGNDINTAEKIFAKGLQLFPQSGTLNNGMRSVIDIKKDIQEEIKFYKNKYEKNPENPSSIIRYAYCLLKDKKYLEAERLYEKVMVMQPNRSNYELGFIRVKLGKEKEGQQLINNYIDLRSKKEGSEYDLARCYALIGNMDEALNYLKKTKSSKIWNYYKDPVFKEYTSTEIADYIETSVKEYVIERKNAVATFREMYEKLIAAGKLKRIEDYL